MKLGDEPSNWLGLGLLLALIAGFAMAIHWFSLPKQQGHGATSDPAIQMAHATS
jgi:hypothetical protein